LQLPPQYYLASGIDAVQLEDPLGDVQTDCGNLHGGRLLQLVALNGPSLAHRCRQGSSTASDEERRVLAEKAKIDRKVAGCTAKVAAETQEGEDIIIGCGGCPPADRREKMARLHRVHDEELGECTQTGIDEEKTFLDREERRLREAIDHSRARIKEDQKSFQRLGFATVSDAFETWGSLADDERRELWKGTILSALTLGLQAIEMASRPIGSFTFRQANSLITRFRAKRISEPFLEQGIRKVAMTSGKPEMMRNVRHLADAIDQGLGTSGALVGLSNGQLEALATLPAVFLKSAEAKAAEALGETIVDFVFAQKAFGVIEPDLNRVLDLADRELSDVHRLSVSIKADINRLNDSKQRLEVVLKQRQTLGN
jgi:hypothetical protein